MIVLFVVALLCVVVLATTVALVLALIGGLMTGVPFVAAPRTTTDALARLCPLNSTSVFYDLGCGDGRFVAAMARRYPSARCIGVERAPLPSLLLRLRSLIAPLPNMRFLYKDFSKVDLSDATHVYLYLLPFVMERLLPKLERELKPGARVVSCDFVFKNRTPDQIIPLDSRKHPHKLYVYEF
jgi:SAM-dependent methyltransferase